MEQKATSKPVGAAEKGYGNANGGKPRHNFKRNNFTTDAAKEAKFEGREEKLKGYIYDSVDFKQADMYTRTTREIADHVGRNYTNGADVRQAIMKGVTPTFATPISPAAGADAGTVCKWKKRIDGIIKREDILEANLKTLFSLIWGQCTEVLRAKIEAVPGFEDVSDDADSLALLVLLKKESYNFQTSKAQDKMAFLPSHAREELMP